MSRFARRHANDSKDRLKRIQWASALKRDQLPKEELEGQQPPMADSEKMMDEPTTSQPKWLAINKSHSESFKNTKSRIAHLVDNVRHPKNGTLAYLLRL
uniref:Uncharacterized protein n=1 Tax=Romanomermis culicivorax TaxID=13658 RepID=A0A915HJ95_ROMCU